MIYGQISKHRSLGQTLGQISKHRSKNKKFYEMAGTYATTQYMIISVLWEKLIN